MRGVLHKIVCKKREFGKAAGGIVAIDDLLRPLDILFPNLRLALTPGQNTRLETVHAC